MIDYDAFELLYIYIEKLDRCFVNTEFSFNDDYDIEYNSKNKKLKISKKESSIYSGFFGDKIKSINLIVGKNGCGKTTLLDLIGSKLDERYNLFNSNIIGWFALYKCGEEDEFYVEGQSPKLLFDERMLEEKSIAFDYSIHFSYDFGTDNIINLFFSGGHCHKDCPFIFYDRERITSKLLPSSKDSNREEYSHLINREYIKKGNLAYTYFLATKNDSFYRKLENERLALVFTIEKYFGDGSEDFENLFKTKNNLNEYESLHEKYRYRYTIMKSLIYDIYEHVIKKSTFKDEYLEDIKKIMELDMLRKINLLCKTTCYYLDKINGIGSSFHFYEFIDEICSKIEMLPDKYFKYSYNKEKNKIFPNMSSVKEELKIIIELSGEFEQLVYNFLYEYEMLDVNCLLYGDLKKILKVKFNNNVSEGELQLIYCYSGIYYSLVNNRSIQKSAIILLDEPDKSFHPMWISSFIDNLVELVNSINNKLFYQFIITTHSPFMLSDIPKKYITCIDIENHKRVISEPKKSFASNYYDIIKSSFFLEYSLGTFAKKKINKLIKDIDELNGNGLKDDVKKLRNRIDIIDDDFLKNSLNCKLRDKISSIDYNLSLKLQESILEEKLKDIRIELGDIHD